VEGDCIQSFAINEQDRYHDAGFAFAGHGLAQVWQSPQAFQARNAPYPGQALPVGTGESSGTCLVTDISTDNSNLGRIRLLKNAHV